MEYLEFEFIECFWAESKLTRPSWYHLIMWQSLEYSPIYEQELVGTLARGI